MPQVTGEKVTGVVEGRIVAYWPTADEAHGSPSVYNDATGEWDKNPLATPYTGKLRAIGAGGYIPAMIVASWAGDGSECPLANLALQLDPSSHDANLVGKAGKGSVRFSSIPAQGCWTWLPQG
jgi:hypothetical protein